MSKSYREQLLRAKFTQSIINIQDDINKLKRMSKMSYRVTAGFQDALDSYIKSSHSLKDYLIFRHTTLEIKNCYMIALEPDTKQIVGNIVLAILGLGIIYGLAVGINYLLNDKTLFFKPEAASRLEAVFDDVDSLKHNPFAATI